MLLAYHNNCTYHSNSRYLSPPPPPVVVYFFMLVPFFGQFGLFCCEFTHLWCTFTGLNNAVVSQKWQISGMTMAWLLWSFNIFGCRAINEIGIHLIAFYVDVSNNTAKLILKPKSTLMPLMMMLLTRPAACPISALDARGPRCLTASTATHYQFSNDILKTGSRHMGRLEP